jgi:hypothetical protein
LLLVLQLLLLVLKLLVLLMVVMRAAGEDALNQLSRRPLLLLGRWNRDLLLLRRRLNNRRISSRGEVVNGAGGVHIGAWVLKLLL